ncbi:dehydrogenase/reductase SDR family member 9 isoform X2 [Salvelinus namaycush]|uniref:Dehydrogenase/reductase SDR family member 9 isoform X2 n=1 Tax=Salvelinus namaycush TaxID=8040 RepID=A0A8U1H6R6_SALNM|nr:dehydrogenase/reductase SDR family member 9 isoform X2 [Salvelinus namaycush]
MFLYIIGLVAFWFVFRWYRELARVPNKGEKYVYITGCDSGFGNLLARHLDKLGFCVIAACYTEKGEDELKKVSSERLNTVHLDVISTDSVNKATAFIKTLVGEKGPCDWMTVDDYKSMLNVNLIGVIGVTLSVLPLIKKARGRVVNVASVFGRISAFGGPYCVSKYGVEAFNDSLRMNMSAFGVKVLCLEPGFFKTSVTDLNLLRKNVKTLWDNLSEEIKDQYGHDYPERANVTLEKNVATLLDGDLMKVVSCMEHAISALHPRTRYSPGWDAKFLWLPMSYMPTWIADKMLLKDMAKPTGSIL